MNGQNFQNGKLNVRIAYDKKRDRPFSSSRGGFNGFPPRGGEMMRGGENFHTPSQNDLCNNCQQPGHWARQCKEERRPR